MDKKQYGNPAVNPATKRGRQDGISKMTGYATFSGSSVSIKVAIPDGGGTQEGTSNFRAGGAAGSNVNQPAIINSASWSGVDLECGTLPKATIGSDYTVAIKYTFNNADRSLQGTISGVNVVLGASPKVTLT